jgi:glycine cleavage system H protein
MKYTKTHEWVKNEGEMATVGVTNYAQNQLGDIVYVELPKVGKVVKAGEEAAVLESTKAAADVYSPVSGEIIEVNEELIKQAELVNVSPEQKGWLFKVRLSKVEELDDMMNETDYKSINSV